MNIRGNTKATNRGKYYSIIEGKGANIKKNKKKASHRQTQWSRDGRITEGLETAGITSRIRDYMSHQGNTKHKLKS